MCKRAALRSKQRGQAEEDGALQQVLYTRLQVQTLVLGAQELTHRWWGESIGIHVASLMVTDFCLLFPGVAVALRIAPYCSLLIHKHNDIELKKA